MPSITIGTTAIPYSIEERPRRQHPAVEIDATRHVTVLIPQGFDPRQVEPLLNRKARWLLKHLTASPVQPTTQAKDFLSVGKASGSMGIPYGSKYNTIVPPSRMSCWRVGSSSVTIRSLQVCNQTADPCARDLNPLVYPTGPRTDCPTY